MTEIFVWNSMKKGRLPGSSLQMEEKKEDKRNFKARKKQNRTIYFEPI